MSEKVNILPLGIDSRTTNRNAPDGLAEHMINLEPIGDRGNISYWKVAAKKENLGISISTDESDRETRTPRIQRAGWQKRNRFGEWVIGNEEDLNRPILHIEENTTRESRIYAMKHDGTNWIKDDALIDFDEQDGEWDVDIKNTEFFTVILANKETDSRLFYVFDDYAFPAILPVKGEGITNNTSVTVYAQTFSDEKVLSNSTWGFNCEDAIQYVCAISTLKLKNGKYINHSQPLLIPLPVNTIGGTGNGFRIPRISRGGAVTEFSGTSDWFDNSKLYRDTYHNSALYINNFWNSRVAGSSIFLTKAHSNPLDAVKDSNYYEYHTNSDEALSVSNGVNEEELLTRRQLDIDPFSNHRYSGKCQFVFNNRVVLGGIYTDFFLPCYNFDEAPGTVTANDNCYHEVTITTESGTYTRVTQVSYNKATTPTPDEYSFSDIISYPDSRATNFKIWVRNIADNAWEVALNVELKAHEGLNIAYNYEASRAVYEDGDSSTTSTTVASGAAALNAVLMYEPSKVKISDSEQFYFPLAQTYDVGIDSEEIIGFASNTDEVSQGQFAQFPLYILKQNSIHAFENSNTSGVLFSRITPISEGIGCFHRDAYCVGNGVLYFASGDVAQGFNLHALRGTQLEYIHYPIEFDQDYAYLGNNSNYPFASKVALDYNFKTEELYWTSQTAGQITFVFNTRFGLWYKRRFADGGDSTLHFFDGIDTSGYKRKYQLTKAVYNELDVVSIDEVDQLVTSYMKYKSKPIKLGDENTYKRLLYSFVRALLTTDSSNTYTVTLRGKRQGFSEYVIAQYAIDGSDYESISDLPLKTNRGSFQTFTIEIVGQMLPTTQIYDFELVYEQRYTHRVRA